jgi:type IV secretion system protein VirB4
MSVSSIIALLVGMLIGGFLYLAAQWVMGFLKPDTLSDVLQWEILAAANMVGMKDRSFLAVWKVRGPDLTFATNAMVDNLADRVRRLLSTLNDETMRHVDSIRVPAYEYATAEGDCPAALDFMDRVRERQYAGGEYYDTTTYFALTISTRAEEGSFFDSFLYSGDKGTISNSYADLLQSAELIADDFESNIPDLLRPERLSGSDLVTYLHTCLSGHHHPVTAPSPQYPSLRYLYAHDMETGFEPHVGDHWFSVVGLWGYPEEMQMGVLKKLDELPFSYRYSNRLVGLGQQETLAAIEKRMGQFQMQANDWLSLLSDDPSQVDPNDLNKDEHSQQMAFEAKDVKRRVQSGQSILHHTGVVLVWDTVKSRAEKKARVVKKVLRNSGGGFVVSTEEGLGTESFIGTLPGHGSQNPRRYLLLAESVARLLPVLGTYAGPTETPCSFYEDEDGHAPPPLFYAKTKQYTPFRFSPYGESGDVGHQMVVGPTGAGKSIFLQFQAARQLHFEGGRSILFDRGYSFAPICEALDGTHYDLSNLDLGFMPLSGIADPSERRWAVSWITSILTLSGMKVGPTERQYVSDALTAMADAYEERQDPKYLTLQEFSTQVQDPQIKAAMKPFDGQGQLDGLLNAEEDIFHDDDFIVIELGDLMELDVEIFTPVLMFLFHRVENILSPTRPTHVVADEFFVFASKSPQGRDYFESALRTYRKKNAFVTLATQAPTDLTKKGMEGIVNSCPTKIMLPNANALDEVQRRGYKELGLNPTQIQVIADSTPKREYIVVQSDGTRRFDLGLTAELAFMTPGPGLSLSETADRMSEHKQLHGSKWIYKYLKYREQDEHLSEVVLDRTRGSGQKQPLLLPAPDGTGTLPSSDGRVDPDHPAFDPGGDGASPNSDPIPSSPSQSPRNSPS